MHSNSSSSRDDLKFYWKTVFPKIFQMFTSTTAWKTISFHLQNCDLIYNFITQVSIWYEIRVSWLNIAQYKNRFGVRRYRNFFSFSCIYFKSVILVNLDKDHRFLYHHSFSDFNFNFVLLLCTFILVLGASYGSRLVPSFKWLVAPVPGRIGTYALPHARRTL